MQVLNGCGDKGVARRVTDFLRKNGYDVIETGNYTLLGMSDNKSYYDMRETIVIDRTGIENVSNEVGRLLGTSNVIKQYSTEHMVDITVIIGKDYNNLLAYK